MLSFLGIVVSTAMFAQSNISAPMNFRIEKEVVPPYLSVVSGSVVFSDADGNKVINASEACSISLKVKNSGRGDAYGCTAKIQGEGTTSGLSYTNQSLPTIKVGETRSVTFPIKASQYTADGSVKFTITVDEPNGFGTDPVQLSVKTHKFESPFVEIVSYKISSDGDSQLRKKKPFKLQVLVQNTDQGVASNVTCSFKLPDNMFILDGERYVHIPELQPNERKMIELEMQSNANVPDELTLAFVLSESYGKYSKNASIPLKFGQAISSGMMAINVAGQEKGKVSITKGSLVSDVDENIPVSNKVNAKTFAVIIANEDYKRVANVPFAMNDGNIFREYCIKTLGILEKHVHYVANATGNEIKAQVHWLQTILEVYDNPRVIFYYAGHGIPDESSKTAYLLPVDGVGTDVSTGYKLDDLYATLGKMPADHITIFMDACFSGSKREDGMLAQARGVAIKTKSGQPQGNMVVFSAAQGDETAYPNREEGHGMFTYFLLKKLQETKGDVTLQELGEFITTNVRQQSIVLNGKSQTPTVNASAVLGSDWQKWKL